jgi:hypothetical protein
VPLGACLIPSWLSVAHCLLNLDDPAGWTPPLERSRCCSQTCVCRNAEQELHAIRGRTAASVARRERPKWFQASFPRRYDSSFNVRCVSGQHNRWQRLITYPSCDMHSCTGLDVPSLQERKKRFFLAAAGALQAAGLAGVLLSSVENILSFTILRSVVAGVVPDKDRRSRNKMGGISLPNFAAKAILLSLKRRHALQK